jgi:TrmH family RNA methyltransferase
MDALITSRSNSLVRLARSLKDRDAREREGLYMVEGVRLVEEALHAGLTPRHVLVCRAQLGATERGRSLLQRLSGLDAALTEVTPDVMAAAADTVTPQGVAALLDLPARAGLPPVRRLALVLDGVQDPGNAGTILRTAAAAGADCGVTTPGTVDLFGPKVLRAGMGAHFRLTLVAGVPWSELAPWVRGRQLLLAVPRGGAPHDRVDWSRPSVLVIGGEAAGAAREVDALNPMPVSIGMAEGAESLNAAAAAAILMFEARRQWAAGSELARPGAT